MKSPSNGQPIRRYQSPLSFNFLRGAGRGSEVGCWSSHELEIMGSNPAFTTRKIGKET